MEKAQWLRTLLSEHEGRLLRYARKFGVTDEHARDLVQETFLRLWKEDRNDLSGREAEWLFCVCRNLCLDSMKKAGTLTDESALAELADQSPSVEEKMQEQESESQILHAISCLSRSQQEVVRLKFQEGFSYKEISRITGHTVSHVGVLLHEAMKKLKSAMQERDGMTPALIKGGQR